MELGIAHELELGIALLRPVDRQRERERGRRRKREEVRVCGYTRPTEQTDGREGMRECL